MTNLYQTLLDRGFIDSITSDDLINKLNTEQIVFYVGFDPTADSFHLGHLAIFNLMRFLQKGGHQPIGLMGGGTGMVGDPSGKDKERNLQTIETIQNNIKTAQKQMELFLRFDSGKKAQLLNNYDWLSKLNLLEFLRDIGKHFPVGQMIKRDSVATRISRVDGGLSFTEFTYMILQGYDFYHLCKEHDCTLQLGGSDQWGNILSGAQLIKKLIGKQAYGLTMPLITKSDGSKFGKSEAGALWLSPEKTSPYEIYQYFLRQSDDDIIRFLKIFTEIDLEEIKELEEITLKEPHLRTAQKKLAEEVVKNLHGIDQLKKAEKASTILFGSLIEDISAQDLKAIFKDSPSMNIDKAQLNQGWSLIDALVDGKLTNSKGNAKKLIKSGGSYVNNRQVDDLDYIISNNDIIADRYIILRSGKKNYLLIDIQ